MLVSSFRHLFDDRLNPHGATVPFSSSGAPAIHCEADRACTILYAPVICTRAGPFSRDSPA